MASIPQFNGNDVPNCTALKEGTVRRVHDRVSILGTARRIWMADKSQVTITWEALTIAQYNAIYAYLYNGAAPVVYSNSVTGLTFTGFPTSESAEFIRGNTFLRSFTTTIVQI